MAPDGAALERAVPAGRAHPQREVDVLVVGEEALVEGTRLVERGEPVRGEAPGRPERRLVGEAVERQAAPQVVRGQARVADHAGRVDALAGRLEEHAGDRAGLAV